MLTMNSPINDFVDIIDIGWDIRNKYEFFYYSHQLDSTSEDKMDEVKIYLTTGKIQRKEHHDKTKKAAIIYLDFAEYSGEQVGEKLKICLLVDKEKCEMVLKYYKDGKPGPCDKYIAYESMIREKFNRFLH